VIAMNNWWAPVWAYESTGNNYDVWATDFADADRSGQSSDNDTTFFDHAGQAIAYYAGHGHCSDGFQQQQVCTHDNQCTQPPSDGYGPGFCSRNPGDNAGHCAYPVNAREVFDARCASGQRSYVNYSNGTMALGETPESGNWAGAAENGGLNFAVIDGSCAAMSNRPSEVMALFAGVQVVAFTMVHMGDKSDKGTPSRAGSFVHYWVADPTGSVASAWVDSINSNDTPGEADCYNYNWVDGGTVLTSYGGGRGFNGCGANMAMAMDVGYGHCNNSLARDWYDISNDSYDTKGAQYYVYEWTCNYDCGTWTFNLP
jgi:hypothetical protein